MRSSTSTNLTMNRRQRIVVIGSGFGGIALVRALRRADAEIILIDRTNHHLFQPLLYQVATAALSPADIATTTRALLRTQSNLTVLMGTVTGVDTSAKQVHLLETEDCAYDDLILATGAAYNFFGNDTWAEHSWVLKSLEDATAIRGRILGSFEWAESRIDPEEVRRLLTFAVVGGGPTGVELAGNIAQLARDTLARDFRNIDPTAARVILIEAGASLLSAFPESLRVYAATSLRDLGVEVLTSTRVTAVDAQGLDAGGRRFDAANVFWAAGTRARPSAAWIGAEAAPNGSITVNPDFTVPGFHNIYAIGDVASYPAPDGHPLPGLAAVAKQEGAYLGKLLLAKLSGRDAVKPFRYKDLGTMAVIGRYRAVARFPKFTLTGIPAWLIWSAVHLLLLMNFRSRTAVYLNWMWSWLTNSRGARLITELPKLLRGQMRHHEGK